MRRFICFLIYAAMIGAGGFVLVQVVGQARLLQFGARPYSTGFMIAGGGILLLFGCYLMWIDFISPLRKKEN